MTSLATCTLAVGSYCKNTGKCYLRWLQLEWFKPGSSNFTHLSGTFGHTNRLDLTSLAASSRLPNATKYCTTCVNVCGCQRVIIRPLFNVESPNFTRTFMPTYSYATPDMTSAATSGRYLSRFEKNRRKCNLQCLWVKF